MSPHRVERSIWSSAQWVWILFAICLIGWRVSTRVEQYRSSFAGPEHQAQVTFFDANERNIASLHASIHAPDDASRSLPRLLAEQTGWLLPAAGLELPVQPAFESQSEIRPGLPPIYTDSVSLFSNPPPPSLA